MSFSGAIKLADLSDYLAPSQSCIVTAPVSKPTNQSTLPANSSNKRPVVSLELDSANDINDRSLNKSTLPSGANFGQIKIKQSGTQSDNQSASISLTDCLACSGCVTSAETILIEAQSWKQVLLQLQSLKQPNENTSDDSIKPLLVLSLSPQSRASLIHHLRSIYHPVDQSVESTTSSNAQNSNDQLINEAVERRLIGYLRHLGFAHVFDCGEALNLAIEQSAMEFIERYRHNQTIKQSTETNDKPFPLLCSECPGWVCYAEKTQGAYILPYLSEMTSSQQIVGRFVKMTLANNQSNNQTNNQQVIHVSVQPCFDKKLEASRPDAVIDQLTNLSAERSKECDYVISTNELIEMINEVAQTHRLIDYHSESEFDSLASISSSSLSRSARVIDHGASGGYADHIFVRAAEELFNVHISIDQLNHSINQSINQSTNQDVVLLSNKSSNQTINQPHWQVSARSSDMRELTLSIDQSGTQTVVLRFARMYGFRHLQSLVKSIKQSNNPSASQLMKQKATYHYVEVMACPSGCVNGGGQIKPAVHQTIKQSKQRLQEVLDIYHQQEHPLTHSINQSIKSPFVDAAHQLWDSDKSTNQMIDQLKVKFYAVKQEDINPLTIKW